MIRTPRRSAARSRVVLAALAAGGVLLAGCGAGQQAQTANEVPTIDGSYAQAGSLALRDITVEYPPGGVYRVGADARLDLVVVNEAPQPDALVEVRTDAAEQVVFAAAGATASAGSAPPTGTASPSESGSPSSSGSESSSSASASASASPAEPSPTGPTRIEIAGNSLVAFRDAGPAIILQGLTRELRPAESVPVTFVFERGGSVTVRVAVAVPETEVAPAPTVPAEGGAEG